jgi:arginine/lysine/ornithine decarboxylase
MAAARRAGLVVALVSAGLSDARLDQSRTPYVDALARASHRVAAPFFLPGHKLGEGLPAAAAPLLSRAARFDLPELAELDNLFAPVGPLADAQALAAEAFGARRTWFLANGSSAGVIAAIVGCVRAARAGETRVLLPRNAHRSAVHGLVHSGAEPVWLMPELDAGTGLTLGIDPPTTLRAALAAHAGRIACVLLVSPTYEGALADVGEAAALCAAAGVPLVIDEAHGAHLGLAPGLPPAALACGASLVVQSTHKTLGALSQAAMLHAGGDDGPRARALDEAVGSAIETVSSSSPSSLLLASLDAARHQVGSAGARGAPALRRAVRLAAAARAAFARAPDALPPLVELRAPAPGLAATDPLRLTVGARALGGGYALEAWLVEEHAVYAELASAEHLTFALGPGTRAAHVRALLRALRAAHARGALAAPAVGALDARRVAAVLAGGEQLATPRAAFYAASEAVALGEAVGRTSAELVYAYPPGVPIICPGERVRAEAVALLRDVLALGGTVVAADAEGGLRTLRVVVVEGIPL